MRVISFIEDQDVTKRILQSELQINMWLGG